MDFAQRALVGAHVRFKPLVGQQPLCVGAQPKVIGAPSVPIISTTDGIGEYIAYLDVGRYAVIVEPPVGVGLAQALVDIVDVCKQQRSGSRSRTASAVKVLNLMVPPPSVVVGEIQDADQNPVSGVRVDVLARGLDKLTEKPAGDNKGGKKMQIQGREKAKLVQETHLLGTAISDEHGRYELLVSPGQLAASDP